MQDVPSSIYGEPFNHKRKIMSSTSRAFMKALTPRSSPRLALHTEEKKACVAPSSFRPVSISSFVVRQMHKISSYRNFSIFDCEVLPHVVGYHPRDSRINALAYADDVFLKIHKYICHRQYRKHERTRHLLICKCWWKLEPIQNWPRSLPAPQKWVPKVKCWLFTLWFINFLRRLNSKLSL